MRTLMKHMCCLGACCGFWPADVPVVGTPHWLPGHSQCSCSSAAMHFDANLAPRCRPWCTCFCLRREVGGHPLHTSGRRRAGARPLLEEEQSSMLRGRARQNGMPSAGLGRPAAPCCRQACDLCRAQDQRALQCLSALPRLGGALSSVHHREAACARLPSRARVCIVL